MQLKCFTQNKISIRYAEVNRRVFNYAGFGRAMVCGFVFLFLTACQVELYRSIPEREANIMIAILQHHNITTTKEESKPEGYYRIWIDESKFSQAVELLSVQGFPRRAHKNLGELFQPSGLVPTQFEEQVRYVYGLSEEITHTISLFDGVVDTRVHIALPQKDKALKGGKKAQVSVYIKYDQDTDFDNLIPQVKKLVSDSVANVFYQDVEVLAVPSYFHKGESQILTAYQFPAGIRVLPEYYSFFIAFCVAILLIILQLGVATVWFYKKWKESADYSAAQSSRPTLEQQNLIEGEIKDGV